MLCPARWLFALAAGGLLAAFHAVPSPLPACGDGADHPVYLVGHGWHAGLVLERAAVSSALWPEQADFPDAVYLEVGWGDSAYYRAPNPGLGVALRAALTPTSSIMHVVGFEQEVTEYFPRSEIIRVHVSPAGLDSLAAYIHQSYARDSTGQAVPLGPGLYGTSRFYAGRARYHLFHNCNAWTARALRAAGCPIRPARILTAADLLTQVRRFGEVIQPKR